MTKLESAKELLFQARIYVSQLKKHEKLVEYGRQVSDTGYSKSQRSRNLESRQSSSEGIQLTMRYVQLAYNRLGIDLRIGKNTCSAIESKRHLELFKRKVKSYERDIKGNNMKNISNCCYEDILFEDKDGHGKCSSCKENCVPYSHKNTNHKILKNIIRK